MIDLHCHILPALDDGALDMDDSVAMGRQADADGIEQVCATPHIRHDHDVAAHELQMRVDALNAELTRAGVKARVLRGGEVSEHNVGGLTDEELGFVSLGGGGLWILLEPGPGPLSESLVEAVVNLDARGFRAVVAHPERHMGADTPALLVRLVERGALVQATAEQFSEPGSDLLFALAGRGLIHLVSSDAHSAHFGRKVKLSDGIGALATIPSLTPHLGWIADAAPKAIVRGDHISAPYPVT